MEDVKDKLSELVEVCCFNNAPFDEFLDHQEYCGISQLLYQCNMLDRCEYLSRMRPMVITAPSKDKHPDKIYIFRCVHSRVNAYHMRDEIDRAG